MPGRKILKTALVGCQARLEKIQAAIADIKSQLGTRGSGGEASSGAIRKNSTLSATARKRWAAHHEAGQQLRRVL